MKFYTGKQMTKEEFEELVNEVINCAKNLQECQEWGNGISLANRQLDEAKTKLMNAYDELVFGIIE